jgi:hypothetical protein
MGLQGLKLLPVALRGLSFTIVVLRLVKLSGKLLGKVLQSIEGGLELSVIAPTLHNMLHDAS